MRVVIDRIEENIAVCSLENGSVINAPAELFDDLKEGRVYDITPNTAEENTRKEKCAKQIERSVQSERLTDYEIRCS